MKIKGFTLAEVLITLGIIGVTAALTLPSLINMHQEASIGPKLAKVQATFEDAATRVMIDIPDKTPTEITPETFMSKIKEYVIFNDSEHLKDGTYVHMNKDTTTAVPNSGQQGSAFILLSVDITGDKKGMDAACVDKFTFELTTAGLVVPLSCAADIANNNWKVPEGYNPSDYNKK